MTIPEVPPWRKRELREDATGSGSKLEEPAQQISTSNNHGPQTTGRSASNSNKGRSKAAGPGEAATRGGHSQTTSGASDNKPSPAKVGTPLRPAASTVPATHTPGTSAATAQSFADAVKVPIANTHAGHSVLFGSSGPEEDHHPRSDHGSSIISPGRQRMGKSWSRWSWWPRT